MLKFSLFALVEAILVRLFLWAVQVEKLSNTGLGLGCYVFFLFLKGWFTGISDV